MATAVFLARLQVGRRWRNLVVIALFVAVVGGVATSLIAGSRRSASVVRRYFDAGIPYRVQVGSQQALPRQQLLHIPGVVRADPSSYFASTQVRADGTLGEGVNGVTYDPSAINHNVRVLAGTLPNATDTMAVGVNESFVKQFGLHAGDQLTVRTYAERDRDDVYANNYDTPHGPEYRFRISAVVRTSGDIALDVQRRAGTSAYGNRSALLISHRFYDANRKDFLTFGDAYNVQLAPSTRTATFEAAVKRMAGTGENAPYFGPAEFAERLASFNTPVGLETTTLLALGIATALAGAIVTAMLLRAQQRAYAQDANLLRALGTTRRQLGTVAALRTAPFAAAGAVLALGLALVLSSRFPIGIGRILELDPGTDANTAVLAIAALIILTIALALAFTFEGNSRSTESTEKRARIGIDRLLARNGAPAELVVGSHLAFDRGQSGRSVPTRPAIAGGAIAIALVIALGVLVSGIDHLYTSSKAHGWPWDAVIGNTNFSMSKARETKLVSDRRIAAATRARYGQATVGTISTEVLAYDPRDDAPPAMLSGRLPRADDEIAPGQKLLRELHSSVGRRVRLSLADGEFQGEQGHVTDRMLTVVGVAIPPVLGESEFGQVAVVALSAIRASGGIADPQLVLARFRGNDSHATAVGLSHDYTPDIALETIPSRVVNLHRVRALPILGALLAAVLGTVLLAYTLAVAVRARIRQLGVLRALGMTSGRVGRVLVWQGIVLAVAITVIGFPIGLILGSIVWHLIANSLGVGPHPLVPVSMLLLVPASIAMGVAASLVPARRARRVDVSRLLAAE